MADAADSWNISNLADLILGGSGSGGPPRAAPAGAGQDAASARPAPEEPEAPAPPCQAVLLLINPAQDAVEAVSRYADYWSNRGESVAVFWMGRRGIKIGLFDCARRTAWGQDILQAAERGAVGELPALVREQCDRVVLALVTSPGWTRDPIVEAVTSVCVIVEAAPHQLVGSYDSLKSLNCLSRRQVLSCFAINTESAEEATELGERFGRLGDQFLDRAIAFDGFSLAERWPASNRFAEAFLSGEPQGRASALRNALAACFADQRPGHGAARTAPAAETAGARPAASRDIWDGFAELRAYTTPVLEVVDGEDLNGDDLNGDEVDRDDLDGDPPQAADRDITDLDAGDLTEPADAPAPDPPLEPQSDSGAELGALPVVQLLETTASINDVGQLDTLIGEVIDRIVSGAASSWPLPCFNGGPAVCRWVQLENGGRCLVLATLGPATGVLEQASACLYPWEPHDQVIVLAPSLTSEQRRAAQGLRVRTRLLEVSRIAHSRGPSGVVLRDVTHAI